MPSRALVVRRLSAPRRNDSEEEKSKSMAAVLETEGPEVVSPIVALTPAAIQTGKATAGEDRPRRLVSASRRSGRRLLGTELRDRHGERAGRVRSDVGRGRRQSRCRSQVGAVTSRNRRLITTSRT